MYSYYGAFDVRKAGHTEDANILVACYHVVSIILVGPRATTDLSQRYAPSNILGYLWLDIGKVSSAGRTRRNTFRQDLGSAIRPRKL